MYLEFYGFSRPPFSMTPEPSNLYPGQPHVKAWSIFEYGLSNRSGIIVLTGEVGSGKTTLIKRLMNETHHQLTIGLISNTHRSMQDLINWVLIAFGQTITEGSQAERYQQLLQFLEKTYTNQRQAVLIVDEAQNLNSLALEELRLLHNLNSENKILLQLILVGQPPLLRMLRHKKLSQLLQRVSVSYHLKPLDLVETVRYIQHRITTNGGDKDLFSHYASATIYYYSSGIPRIINTLCDLTLAYGFSVEAKKINPELVLEVIQSKRKSGLFPILNQHKKDAENVRKLIKEKTDLDIGIFSAAPGTSDSAL
ncbi:MAG TPA: DUF2075 domain-containing protein [Crenotrichaceae bacterium]|nr:DUF2075 domain-containing protein [Crenotrichaceae bacterium]